MMDTNQHAQEAQRFLQRAGLFTAESDSLARAEMLWCAAAHIVKALAVQRRWNNNSHDELFDCVGKIHGAIGYPEAYGHFTEADRLHRHMYQGHMERRALDDAETTVRHFVNRIANAISAYAAGNGTTPS